MLSAACQHGHAPVWAQKKPPCSFERKLSQKQLENPFQQPPQTLNGEAHHLPCSDTELRSRRQRILRGGRQRVTSGGKGGEAKYNSDSLHLFLLSFLFPYRGETRLRHSTLIFSEVNPKIRKKRILFSLFHVLHERSPRWQPYTPVYVCE